MYQSQSFGSLSSQCSLPRNLLLRGFTRPVGFIRLIGFIGFRVLYTTMCPELLQYGERAYVGSLKVKRKD